MKNFLRASAYSTPLNLSLLLIRIGGGGFMLTHGYGKLQQLISGNIEFGDPIGLGEELSLGLTVFAEFFCGLLLLVGFLSRLAAIPLIITMLVAILVVHAGQEFGNIELGLFYLISSTVILLCGPGKYSVDYAAWKR